MKPEAQEDLAAKIVKALCDHGCCPDYYNRLGPYRNMAIDAVRACLAGSTQLSETKEADERPKCQDCGGPHQFDMSVPSVVWNHCIRAAGLPDYLCATCILRAFARKGESFTATLWSDELHGVPIEVRVRGAAAKDIARVVEENNRLRCDVRELTARLEVQREAVAKYLDESVAGVPDPPSPTSQRSDA